MHRQTHIHAHTNQICSYFYITYVILINIVSFLIRNYKTCNLTSIKNLFFHMFPISFLKFIFEKRGETNWVINKSLARKIYSVSLSVENFFEQLTLASLFKYNSSKGKHFLQPTITKNFGFLTVLQTCILVIKRVKFH